CRASHRPNLWFSENKVIFLCCVCGRFSREELPEFRDTGPAVGSGPEAVADGFDGNKIFFQDGLYDPVFTDAIA
ncbi:MAG TPA: hypothetical protein VLN56_03950, partial [Gammaproteobacteria bacterium]|nr:hypothetical protein [Gammaproteobacteria bacterium]